MAECNISGYRVSGFQVTGFWVGELAREAEWIRIIGVDCDGWVRAEDLEERPPFQLHAYWTAGKPIEYINAADVEK